MKNILLILFFLASSHVEACTDFMANWDDVQWIKGSESIYHGIIVSISLSDEEINDGETDPLFNLFNRSDKHITFKVFETLKGDSQKVINVILDGCFGGIAYFGQEVILFKVKNTWHIKENVKKSLANNILKQLSTIEHVSGIVP